MKKSLTVLAAVAALGLSACAVVPAYGPGVYYESDAYYNSRPSYAAPVWVVPGPVVVPRYYGHGHRHRHHGRGGWRR